MVWDLDAGEPSGGPTFVQDEEAAAAYDRELLDLAAAILCRFEPEEHHDRLELTMRRKLHSRLDVLSHGRVVGL